MTRYWESGLFNGKDLMVNDGKIPMTIIDETKATYSFKEGRFFFSSVDDKGR